MNNLYPKKKRKEKSGDQKISQLLSFPHLLYKKNKISFHYKANY